MSDNLILSVEAMLKAYPMKGDKNDMYIICYNLLLFSYEKGLLLKSPFKEDGQLNTKIIIRDSDLTTLGKRVFNDLMYDWLNYTSNTSGTIDKKNNLKMLEKYYNKIKKHNVC